MSNRRTYSYWHQGFLIVEQSEQPSVDVLSDSTFRWADSREVWEHRRRQREAVNNVRSRYNQPPIEPKVSFEEFLATPPEDI